MGSIERKIGDCQSLPDDRLTEELKRAAENERVSLIELLVRLREFDRRELSERKGYPSAFEYCRRVLGYSRSGAGRRVAVARAAKRFPSLLAMIQTGHLHLTGVAMIAGYLTSENHRRVLRAVRGKSEDEIARFLAGVSPRRLSRDSIRITAVSPPANLLTEAPGQPTSSFELQGSGNVFGARPSAMGPSCSTDVQDPGTGDPQRAELFLESDRPEPAKESTGAESYSIRFEASPETVVLPHRAQELLRHKFPRGELDLIIRLALKLLTATVDRDLSGDGIAQKTRSAKTRARPSRNIPESIKRAVWRRDGGKCTFVGDSGVRCGERAWIEFDHRKPFALGGASDNLNNIRLLCRRHNQLLAREMFGGPSQKSV